MAPITSELAAMTPQKPAANTGNDNTGGLTAQRLHHGVFKMPAAGSAKGLDGRPDADAAVGEDVGP
jgi:hypothetical protein